MTFTLIGMPGSGKSCMGRAISGKLKMKNIDADKLIEKTVGKPLQEYIDEYGKDEFKKIEEKVLLSIKDDNVIISTGGSAVYSEAAMNHFRSIGKTIYLYISFDTMIKRLGDFGKRGIVMRDDQTIRDVYNERVELYKKYADITINCDGTSYSKYRAKVIAAIEDAKMKI